MIPAPDPGPGAKGKIVYVAYDWSVKVKAYDAITGEPVDGWWMKCHIPIPGHGHKHCVIFHK